MPTHRGTSITYTQRELAGVPATFGRGSGRCADAKPFSNWTTLTTRALADAGRKWRGQRIARTTD